MEKIKWGIIGPGSIANNFADGLLNSYSGQLVGIASKNDERRKSFGDKYNVHEDFRFETYEDIINSEHIDATKYVNDHEIMQITQKWGELYNSLVAQQDFDTFDIFKFEIQYRFFQFNS